MLFTLLIVLLLVALLGGGYGHSRGWGYYGWSPLGLIVLLTCYGLLLRRALCDQAIANHSRQLAKA